MRHGTLIAAFLILSGFAGADSNEVLFDDFVAFWSAGRLVLNGQNPYDAELFRAIQASTGWTERLSFPMWYPPWAFSLMLPFSTLNYADARIAWLCLNLALLVISSTLLWRVYHGPKELGVVAWGVALLYCPDLFTLRIGQMTFVPLLGLVGFLLFESQGKVWLSGASLALASVKPHLAYLVWAGLFLWVLDRRQWRVGLSLAATLSVAVTVSLFFNPHLISQFFASREILQVPLFHYKSPTLGSLLRIVLGEEKLWLRFLPSILALVGFVLYWMRARRCWNWHDQLPVLLVVSLPTAFYAWSYDFALLLPAIMQIAVWVCQQMWRRQMAFALAFLGLSAVGLLLNIKAVDDFSYFWFSPSILLLYLLFRYLRVREVGDEPVEAAGLS